MPNYTKNLNLFKYDPSTDGSMSFDVQKALNDNFDKIDSNSIGLGNMTNCILEIPQRIKYTLEDGTLTIKAGSVIIVPYGVKDLTTEFPVGAKFLHDNFKVYDTQFADEKFFVWAEIIEDSSGSYTISDSTPVIRSVIMRVSQNSLITLATATSGSEEATPTTNLQYYNTTTNKVECWINGSSGVTLNNSACSFPLFLVKSSGTSGTYIHAEVTQVFNGSGYIGSTYWVDKGIKGLIPNGRNTDGTLKNIEFTNSTLRTNTFTSYTNSLMPVQICERNTGWADALYIQEDMPNDNYSYWYQPSTNILHYTASIVGDIHLSNS